MFMLLGREVRRVPMDYEPAKDAGGNWEPEFERSWPEGTVLGVQMYETVTEGTPISSVHPDTPEGHEGLARELAFHGGGGIANGMTVDDWMRVIDGDYLAKDIHTGEIVGPHD